MSMVYGIQGQLLDVTVVGCNKLKDTEWLSRQDPYVCLEYASTKFRTRTCTDGGKHPVFQEKTVIPLIEGLREINVTVWNSNTVNLDDYIGSARIQLQKVLSQGYDDSCWPLQSRSGKFAGEVKVILHFQNAQKSQMYGSGYAAAPPMHMGAPTSYGAPPYYAPPKSVSAAPSYPPPVEAYPVAHYSAFPTAQTAAPYPPSTYPPPMQYPQQQQYPPQTYPPPQAHYPPGPYPGVYPPPPY